MDKETSKLLIVEQPLQVLPSLASLIGLNEAIFLQQVHYWLQKSNHTKNDKKWVYNSISEWREQFPFWSEKTIERIAKKLCDRGILIKANHNKSKFDRTWWYTIDYELLKKIENGEEPPEIKQTPKQTDCLNGSDNLSQPIPETTNRDTNSLLKELNTPDSENRASASQKFDFRITRNHIKSCLKKLGYDVEKNAIAINAPYVFEHYYEKYEEKLGKNHPKLNDKTMMEVVRLYANGFPEYENRTDLPLYFLLIDEYFNSDLHDKSDYNIRCFMSEKNRYILAMRLERG